MFGPTDLAKGWIAKGDSDFATARLVLQSPGPYDTACFHAQQAAEKYLKAVVALAGLPIPHTHDLERILSVCVGAQLGVSLAPARLASLTPYAVQLRYSPTFWPDAGTVRQALDIVDEVRAAVAAALPPGTVPCPPSHAASAAISPSPPPPPPAPAPPP
ncbi:MAG: HEPN domain-containing protein [Planctomycetes bacterium]|nr:HEPN domain-containing protein [Planctomycetota bacterium]